MRKRLALRLKPDTQIVIKETGEVRAVVGVAIVHKFPIHDGIVAKAIRIPLIMCNDHVYKHSEVLKK